MTTPEQRIERGLIAKLCDLKCTYRPDIRDQPRRRPTSAPNGIANQV